MKLECLTPEEIETAFSSNDLIPGFHKYESVELVNKDSDYKTVGFLIMAVRIEDNKRVGILHRELNKPLVFEKESDSKAFLKRMKQLTP